MRRILNAAKDGSTGTPRRRRAFIAGFAALALAASGLVAAPSATAASRTITGEQAVDMVNPFIGTLDDGNTFPGATTPFGMIQLSPDTGHTVGYDYNHSVVRGFSQMHLSGVGCGLGGFVPITPATSQPSTTNYADGGYSRSIKKDGSGAKIEEATAGHYGVTLESGVGNDINVDLTATPRTGIQRYEFATTGTTGSFVRINAGQTLSRTVHSSKTTIDVANQIVRTETRISGFCQDTKEFTVWSTTKFNQPFVSYGTWVGGTVSQGVAEATSTSSAVRTGATLQFDHNATVEMQTAISYVSAEGADENLEYDRTTYADNYDDALTVARDLWAEQLGKVKVTQGDTNAPTGKEDTQLRVFYSALYRSFVAPNLASDANGQYRGWDGEIHALADDGLSEYYQNFSLWDTYRTQEQWLYLIEPTRSIDMAKSLVLQSEQSGWLPRWGYGPVETNTMTGDPGAVFLVSAWSQGLLKDEWAERAYEVITHNADNVPNKAEFANGRAGNPVYIPKGYVPQNKAAKDRDTDYDLDHGGSATLEYALADAMIAYMAKGLGHEEDAERYALRGQNFRSLWNPDSNSFQARDADGYWVASDSEEGKSAFHEGTAPQYEWLVQQDVPSIIELFGGKQATEERLDTFFAFDSIDLDNHPGQVAHNEDSNRDWWVTGTYDYYGTKTYNPNNEPDLHAPYIYLWTGQPWKASDVVREALELFTDAPNGVTGNDDLGTMAAWQVTSTIGIFPIAAGTNLWGLTTPVFDKVEIALEEQFHGSDSLVITADGVSMSNRYVQSVSTDGDNLAAAYIDGSDLVSAGTLDYTVGDEPSTWATDDAASPGSIVTAQAPTRFNAVVTGGTTPLAPGDSSGTSTTVSLQVTGTEEVSGELQAYPYSGISVEVTSGKNVSLNPRGGTAMTTADVTITADESLGAGIYPISWKIGDLTATTQVTVTDVSPLADAGVFNNKAFGDRGDGNSAKFNHTATSSSAEFFLRDIAAASGMPLGVTLPLQQDSSMSYVLHDSGAGSDPTAYDNVVITSANQNIDVTGRYPGATKVAFIVAANNNSVENVSAQLKFSDSSTKNITISATDWCSQTRVGDNVRASRAKQRWAGQVQDIGCGLWETGVIDLEGKELTGITFPTEAPRLHIFALATDAGITATGQAEISVPTNPAVGTTLTATPPQFSGVDDVTVSYQWLRDGLPISGATSATYTAGADDANTALSVQITGKAAGFPAQNSVSDPITIAEGTLNVVTAPKITGTAQVSQELAVSPGQYSASDVTETYQWLADDEPIAGATGSTLTLSSAELDKSIRVAVAASKPGYTTISTTTQAVGPVTPAPEPAVVVQTRPSLTGKAKVGAPLSVKPGSYSPAAIETYQWNVAGKPVSSARGSSFTPRAADAGKPVTVTVTATSSSGLTASITLEAGSVARGTMAVTKKPKLKRGSKKLTKKTRVKVGQKIKTTKGKVLAPGSKVTVKYRWFIGKKKVKKAKGAKKAFRLTKKAIGKKVSVRITYKAAGYTKTVVKSAKTSKVKR